MTDVAPGRHGARHRAEDAAAHAPKLPLADRLQPVLLLVSVGLGLGVSRAAPDLASATKPAVSVGVIVLIFLVMLNVDLGGVGRAFAQRRFLIVAVALNFIVNPIVAWAMGAVFLGDAPELWAGLILFLVTPCIGWYLIFTELAGGDVTLGVSLLAINVVLQLALLPVYLWLFAGNVLTLDATTVATSLATFLLLPFIAAGGLRWWLGQRSLSAADVHTRYRLAHVKTLALVVVIVSMFASQGETVFDHPGVVWRIAPPVALFFGIAFVMALAAARAAGLPYEQTALLAFTTTSRNSEASLAIAATAFTSPLVALTVVIGPVIELPLLVMMVRGLHAMRPTPLPTTPDHDPPEPR